MKTIRRLFLNLIVLHTIEHTSCPSLQFEIHVMHIENDAEVINAF